jgi:hypothetical protein
MTRRLWWLLLVLPLFGSCECLRPGPVDPIEIGLRVQPSELDFGRVLEGATRTLNVTLTSATRAAISVELDTDPPFDVGPSAEVPGGGDLEVPVTFRAGSETVEGLLRFTVGDRTAVMKLRGTGVRPLDCQPSAVCIVSVYSLEEDRCIESQAPDDAPCDTASVCLEQGRCRAGECLGIARRCDDNNICTDDACAMDVGCIHTPHMCPTPTAACRVATCDPFLGCGDGPAPDLTACGPQDCVEVNFCFSGACRTQPTPDGLPCSPAIACLPEAQCHNQVCTRPTEAAWVPAWSARLAGEPVGEIGSSSSTLFFSICVDAGLVDAGVPDAGVFDAGAFDAGEDGGLDDGGLDDGGLDDGGLDAGEVDAGFDAGAFEPAVRLACSLTSYTGTGFERFDRDGGVQPNDYGDGELRSVIAVNGGGVILARDGGLELRSPTTGALRSELLLRAARSLIVVERERVLFWADGGVQAWVDGGVTFLASVAEPAALGKGAALFSWSPDAGLLTRFALLADGGLESQPLSIGGVTSNALAVTENVMVFGSSGRGRFDGLFDGGFVAFDWSTTPVSQFLDEQTLTSSLATNVFFRVCDGGCGGPDDETHVRVFDPAGDELWQVAVINQSFPGQMLATSLVDGRPGGFVTLARFETDAGPRAAGALFFDGERKAICRLPDTSGAIEQAHFSATALVITVRRPDGTVVLESYPLGALPLSRSSWATPQGVAGTRSDRP